MSVGATARLSRLLTMVPWLLQRQGVPLAEAAAHFEISQAELVKDLELLFVCGTPGHLPDDLIDADWESGRVYLRNADAISRPLRLGIDEAVALLVGLRTLADVPGLHDRDALESALTKLSTAAGDAASAAAAVTVDLSRGVSETTLGTLRDAVRRRRRVHLRYLVPSRDETTERDVDPIRVMTLDGRWYLDGWCHRAESARRFRLDRVVSVDLLDADGTPPAGVVPPDLDELFSPSPDDLMVTVDLAPQARWVAEYYPVEQTVELAGGGLRVRLRTASPDWLPRLALQLGGGMRVISPPEVVGRVAELADAALAAYS
ncbi:MAG: WYL domain-containing protein [Kineosporiaceae bacterium]|nr:WYL domain-containing protein [Kineosporiaceae bacterium]